MLGPDTAAAYRELLGPDGVSVALRSRRSLFGERPVSFEDALAALLVHGEVAIGIYPDPRRSARDPERIRREMLEGAAFAESAVWLNPPRSTALPDDGETAIAVLTRRR